MAKILCAGARAHAPRAIIPRGQFFPALVSEAETAMSGVATQYRGGTRPQWFTSGLRLLTYPDVLSNLVGSGEARELAALGSRITYYNKLGALSTYAQVITTPSR